MDIVMGQFDGKFWWDILMGHFDGTSWWNILMGYFKGTFWGDILMGHFDGIFWWDNLWYILIAFDDRWCQLMTIDDRWWPLMTVDDRWWPLMIVNDRRWPGMTFDMVLMLMGWLYDSFDCLLSIKVWRWPLNALPDLSILLSDSLPWKIRTCCAWEDWWNFHEIGP